MAAIPKCTCFFIMLVALGINGFVILGRRGQPNSNANTQPEDPYRVMADLVLPHGYPLTEHFVVTTDGYILRLFRLGPKPGQHSSSSSASTPAITSSSPGQSQQSGEQPPHPHLLPGAAATADVCSRPVVFLQHPLMGSSVDYVVLGPGRSLGFMLVDAGYDVWLTNVRGNRFSRNHTRLDPDSPADVAAFWAFSWDQHVALDLPAAVERVAAHTGCQRMMFVGYSQGTTIGLAALATQPRVASRVAAAVLLAPVAFVTHMNSAPFRLMALVRVEKLFNWLGLHEYAAHVPWFADKAARFCTRCPRLCAAYLFLLCGANPRGGNLDPGVVPAIMHYLPSGTSVQNMAHWGQLVRSANRTRLSYYDYGTECGNETAADTASEGSAPKTGGQHACNQQAYHSPGVPEYSLGAVATPLALFTGGRDRLADPWDSELLLAALRPGGMVQLHHDEPDYGHLDFGVGHDAADRIYPLVLDFFRKHTAAAAVLAAGSGDANPAAAA